MKNCNASENQTMRRILLIACATALAVAFTVSLPQPAHADRCHTATRARRHSRCQRGTRRSSWVTPSAPRTTSACRAQTRPLRHVPTPPASPGYSSRRRPPCSMTMTSNSSPTTSAPTPALIPPERWHDSRHVAALAGHEHRLGPGHRLRLHRRFVAPGAIAWLLLKVVGAQDGPTGGHTLTDDHLRPAAEHLWRGRALDRLYL